MGKAKEGKSQPIYVQVKPQIDPDTGELRGCLTPNSWIDSKLMRERKYRTGDVLRLMITNPRNQKFHRLVHQLGTLVRQNIDGFQNLNSHEAIKRLQRESGVCCEVMQIDASPVVEAILAAAESLLGVVATKMLRAVLPEIKTIDVVVPQSISYDDMDESTFRVLFSGICGHLVDRYWPTLGAEQVAKLTEILPHSEGA